MITSKFKCGIHHNEWYFNILIRSLIFDSESTKQGTLLCPAQIAITKSIVSKSAPMRGNIGHFTSTMKILFAMPKAIGRKCRFYRPLIFNRLSYIKLTLRVVSESFCFSLKLFQSELLPAFQIITWFKFQDRFETFLSVTETLISSIQTDFMPILLLDSQ